jgi:hypothetical protein
MLLRSDMSGMSCLCRRRASVETFPLWWAFPTSAYDARYDSPDVYGGLSLSQDSSACLPPSSIVVRRFPHCSVSGFPLPCLRSWRPYTVLFHGQERVGPPKCFDASLPACHGLRTPADLPLLANTDGLVLPSVCVKTLGVRSQRLCEAVPALQGARSPLRPPGCAVDASPLLFAACSTTTPPWTPDALRVDGYSLPDRDFHPARDAKLSWRDNAQAEARVTTPPTHELGKKPALWPVASSARLCENSVFGACGFYKLLILLDRIFEKLTFHTVWRRVRPGSAPRGGRCWRQAAPASVCH